VTTKPPVGASVDLRADAESSNAPLAPPPGRRRQPRILELTFSGPGVAVGTIFASFSLEPSLLPRIDLVQGIASGVSLMVG